MGMTCGVVTGALMGLGILLGRDEREGKVDPAFEAAAKFVDSFRRQFGTMECRDLTGLDLTSRAQRRLMAVKKVKEKRCSLYLLWAVGELSRYLP